MSHAKGLVHATVGKHPLASAMAMGVMALLILYLMYQLHACKNPAAAPAKSGYVTAVNNMTHGGANPLWHLGNGDAGHGGSVHRDATPYHQAALHPGGGHVRAPSCGAWSADARDEAQALAAVGSFAHDTYGDRALQGAINAAYDSGSSASAVDALTASDAVLTNVMHKGSHSP